MSPGVFDARTANRREVAAYAGLVPTPWRSGTTSREQGISKAGSRRLRTTMIELAWLWVWHQPESVMRRWFRERVDDERGRMRRIAIVDLARKLLIVLWRYLMHGEIRKGTILKFGVTPNRQRTRDPRGTPCPGGRR
jgi:transposase